MPSSQSVHATPLLQQHCRLAFMLASVLPVGREITPIKRTAWPKAALVAEQRATQTPWPHLAYTCAQALREVSSNADEYCSSTILTVLFMDEAMELVNAIVQDENTSSNELYDYCFGLLECLAAMIKENCRSKSGEQLRQDQRNIMHFFETSGEWRKGDGSLVSEYYYELLAIS